MVAGGAGAGVTVDQWDADEKKKGFGYLDSFSQNTPKLNSI